MPRVPRVPSKNDAPRVRVATSVLDRHGYGVSVFNRSGVGFFKKSAMDADGNIPIYLWYFMGHKEFTAFMEVLVNLDETKARLAKFSEYVAKNL
jgi:hypothetical protein